MQGDPQVLDKLFESLEELVNKLEICVNKNKVDEVIKIKREILEIQKKLTGELG